MCDIGVYPKGRNIFFSLPSPQLSVTFNTKIAFIPDTGKALICFLSDKKMIIALEECLGMQICKSRGAEILTERCFLFF